MHIHTHACMLVFRHACMSFIFLIFAIAVFRNDDDLYHVVRLNMYVYMCVCVYLYLSMYHGHGHGHGLFILATYHEGKWMYVYKYLCMHHQWSVCMFASMYVCTYVCMHVFIYVCTPAQHTYDFLWCVCPLLSWYDLFSRSLLLLEHPLWRRSMWNTHTHMHIHTHVQACMYACMPYTLFMRSFVTSYPFAQWTKVCQQMARWHWGYLLSHRRTAAAP